MWSQRQVVDYALARRATLADLSSGRVAAAEVCDAHPYLLRAARYYGEPTTTECPVCRRERLCHVTYTYGDCFRSQTNGRVRRSCELPALAREFPSFTVYVVEVCRSCGWNHLASSYVLGSAGTPARAGRRARSGGQEG